MRRLSILAVALVLVLAGCGSPTTTPTGENTTTPAPEVPATATDVTTSTSTVTPLPTATPSITTPLTAKPQATPSTTQTPPNSSNPPEIAVKGESLPVEPGRVFAQVQSLLGTHVAPPQSVVVRDRREISLTGYGPRAVPPFWSLLGVTPTEPTEPVSVVKNGYTTALGRIVLYLGEQPNATSVSWLLAHEFVHYIQFSRRQASELRRALSGISTDNRFVYRAILEGVAVYTTNAYIARHAPAAEPNSALYTEIAAAFPAGSYQWYANSQYIEGTEYIRGRFDTPAAVDAVYASPPQTSEQLIHGLSPAVEPARPLTVTLRANESAFIPIGKNTMGEAFVRTVLANGVSESRAARAAAGWGADRLVIARTPDGDTGYAWVLRWDDAENATEFVAAFRAYQRVHEMEGNSELRLTSVSNETVVILAGDSEFVDAAVVNGTSGAVTVTIESTDAHDDGVQTVGRRFGRA